MRGRPLHMRSLIFVVLIIASVDMPAYAPRAPAAEGQTRPASNRPVRAVDLHPVLSDSAQPVGYNYFDHTIPGFAFSPEAGARFGRTTGNFIFHQNGSAPMFTTSFWLPSGALLTHIYCSFYDVDASADVEVWVADNYQSEGLGTPATIQIAFIRSEGGSGYTSTLLTLDPPYTITNWEQPFDYFATYHFYSVVVRIFPTSNELDLQFGFITLWYQLQVSPAPTVATFNDVSPVHWAFQHVEALAESGISAGCGGGSFCPNATVTRAEMAVFLAKALGLQWPFDPSTRQ